MNLKPNKIGHPAAMCVAGTPLELYPEHSLLVKREDLSCPGGPNFSKTRGVWERVASRSEEIIGVLDTGHSQGGWAVARACALLGKQCLLYYPVLKIDRGQIRSQQLRARELGATLIPMRPHMSAVLWHQARKKAEGEGGYMMPNALKLFESVEQTAAEVVRTLPLLVKASPQTVLVSASSGTIAAGVVRGFRDTGIGQHVIIHMGYSRSHETLRAYVESESGGLGGMRVSYIDEKYTYADKARSGPSPTFPCNEYYDLKAFRWWCAQGVVEHGSALFWNVG